jgi:hypothetical protein
VKEVKNSPKSKTMRLCAIKKNSKIKLRTFGEPSKIRKKENLAP